MGVVCGRQIHCPEGFQTILITVVLACTMAGKIFHSSSTPNIVERDCTELVYLSSHCPRWQKRADCLNITNPWNHTFHLRICTRSTPIDSDSCYNIDLEPCLYYQFEPFSTEIGASFKVVNYNNNQICHNHSRLTVADLLPPNHSIVTECSRNNPRSWLGPP